MDGIKTFGIAALAVFGSILADALGGWDTALQTLVAVMLVDYITGIIVAGVFKKSKKSMSGALESHAGFKGLLRKGVVLAVVLVASMLDLTIGSDMIRDCVIIAYVANELLSIAENLGLMGVPFPKALVKAIEMLRSKAGEDSEITENENEGEMI